MKEAEPKKTNETVNDANKFVRGKEADRLQRIGESLNGRIQKQGRENDWNMFSDTSTLEDELIRLKKNRHCDEEEDILRNLKK